MKRFLRWTILIVLLAAALFLLNNTLACLWAAGGPTTDYPEIWGQRAVWNFCLSVAALSTGVMGFVAFGSKFSFRSSKLKYLWVIVVALCFAYPNWRAFLLQDKCLDSGGSWDSTSFKCKR